MGSLFRVFVPWHPEPGPRAWREASMVVGAGAGEEPMHAGGQEAGRRGWRTPVQALPW